MIQYWVLEFWFGISQPDGAAGRHWVKIKRSVFYETAQRRLLRTSLFMPQELKCPCWINAVCRLWGLRLSDGFRCLGKAEVVVCNLIPEFRSLPSTPALDPPTHTHTEHQRFVQYTVSDREAYSISFCKDNCINSTKCIQICFLTHLKHHACVCVSCII